MDSFDIKFKVWRATGSRNSILNEDPHDSAVSKAHHLEQVYCVSWFRNITNIELKGILNEQ